MSDMNMAQTEPPKYYSQIGQDKWVHSVLGNKRNGYFIELGACDGVHLSNTLFFERTLGWNGICIEPNDTYLEKLKSNRKCNVSNELVYSVEGKKVEFAMCNEVSGIIDENIGPFTNKTRSMTKITTTLGNILDKFNAPTVIDYLSLDVEGQEYNILSTFSFDKYKFRCITVEHNAPHIGPKHQIRIRELLESKGYTFVKGNDDVNNWGHGPIDDFYIYSGLV
jgi:FkbM family methyltransferase